MSDMTAPDLDTFAPTSAKALADGLLGKVETVLGADWVSCRDEIVAYLQTLAAKTWQTKIDLETGALSKSDAKLALQNQKILANSIMLDMRFMTYAAAQDVLNGVFSLIEAAIKNLTGFNITL